MSLFDSLKKKHPTLKGSLIVKNTEKFILVCGNIVVDDKKSFKLDLETLIKEKYPTKLVLYKDFELEDSFTVIEDDEEIKSTDDLNPKLDEVKIIYQGYLPVEIIEENDKYKNYIEDNYLKFKNIFNVFEFMTPIILDGDLKIIDGNLRLQFAKELGYKNIPAIIINEVGIKAELLRLMLNRTQEFQRWNYEEVDPIVDSIEVAQPLLEPIGFFGQKLLPESFFSNSILDYKIDVFNRKHAQYKQDESLAEWAAIRREEILKAKEEKEKQRKAPKKKNAVSLFSLKPKEEDFLETYDVKEVLSENENKLREVSDNITKNYDVIRKAEKERLGQAWQVKMRRTPEFAKAKREEFIEKLKNNKRLTEEQINQVIDSVDNFRTIDEINEFINSLIEENENNE